MLRKLILVLFFIILIIPLTSAWWNSSWSYKKNVTITEGNYANRTLEPIEINLTGLKLSTDNCTKEIRIVDENDNEISSQITNDSGQALGDGSEWCKVLFLTNVTQNTAVNYSVYYGNAGATAPSYTKTSFNQTTCPLTFDSGYFDGVMEDVVGAIDTLTTQGGISMDFSAEELWTTTQGVYAACSVIENGNVRSKINVTQSDFWATITIYQNAEKINFTIEYTSALAYVGADIDGYATNCSNISNVIDCGVQNLQHAVSERWFSSNSSNAVIYTGWSNLDYFYRYDVNGRKVWFYDGASKGNNGWSLYFGASNQTTGWQYAQKEYYAYLNPVTTALGTEETTDTCTCPGINQNWAIAMSDYCNITTACDLGTGTLSFTGAGWCNCNASVDTTNLGDPGASGVLYIQDSCLITID